MSYVGLCHKSKLAWSDTKKRKGLTTILCRTNTPHTKMHLLGNEKKKVLGPHKCQSALMQVGANSSGVKGVGPQQHRRY